MSAPSDFDPVETIKQAFAQAQPTKPVVASARAGDTAMDWLRTLPRLIAKPDDLTRPSLFGIPLRCDPSMPPGRIELLDASGDVIAHHDVGAAEK